MIVLRWTLASIRLLLFVLITAVSALWAAFTGLLQLPFPVVYTAMRLWRFWMIHSMGIRIETQGEVPTAAALILPNHRSYTDVLVMQLPQPLVFVAKIEVSRWPILGWGSTAVHTVWIDRHNRDSRRATREQIENRLTHNESVIVFPEGTTFRGPEALNFRPGMFQVVARTGVPVIPVAIEYENQDMAWVDDDTFLRHFMSQFGQWCSRVKVRFGPPMLGDDPDELRQRVQAWVNKSLLEMRDEWENG